MYLFNRTRSARTESIMEATTWAVEIAAKASSISGVEVALWASVLSDDIGRLSWTARFDDLAQWETLGNKLVADEDYVASVVGAANLFTGPVSDGMVEVVHGGSAGPIPRFEYVTVVSATATNGNFAAAMAQGVALADAASAASGLNTVFTVDVTGNYAGVRWITGAPNVAALEAARHAVNADGTVLQLLDSGGHLFIDGATAVHHRIA
ncbi:MAG: hypothetical protein WCC60_22370 [Ilumatobacteraceae bacterium]